MCATGVHMASSALLDWACSGDDGIAAASTLWLTGTHLAAAGGAASDWQASQMRIVPSSDAVANVSPCGANCRLQIGPWWPLYTCTNQKWCGVPHRERSIMEHSGASLSELCAKRCTRQMDRVCQAQCEQRAYFCSQPHVLNKKRSNSQLKLARKHSSLRMEY